MKQLLLIISCFCIINIYAQNAPVISIQTGDSNSANITETNTGLTTNATLTLTDNDIADTVSIAVTNITESGTTSGITNNTLLSFLTIPSGNVLDNMQTQNQFIWIFNSGSEAFNYLDETEALVLTFTITATDSQNASSAINTIITISGTNDAPIVENINQVPFYYENESFTTGEGSFTYIDDTFRGTSNPAFSNGNHELSAGQTGDGAIRTTIGGVDTNVVDNMSGGFTTTINVTETGPVYLTMSYRFTMSSQYENGVIGQVLASLDGTLVGLGGNDYIEEHTTTFFTPYDSGWVSVTLDLGALSIGNHDIIIGGYNSHKDLDNESMEVFFDSVEITDLITASQNDIVNGTLIGSDSENDDFTFSINTPPTEGIFFSLNTMTGEFTFDPNGDFDDLGVGETRGVTFTYLATDQHGAVSNPATVTITIKGINDAPTVENSSITINKDGVVNTQPGDLPITEILDTTPTIFLENDFDIDASGFVYSDDTFRNTSGASQYADGVYNATGGQGIDGSIDIALGGIDNDFAVDMSGGFITTINLVEPSQVYGTFSYRMLRTPEYEADEISQVLVSIDGQLVGQNGNDYIIEVSGDGNGGPIQDTGWVSVSLFLGNLTAGNHNIIFGGYNNKKTFVDESTTITFDEIEIFSSLPNNPDSNPVSGQLIGSDIDGDDIFFAIDTAPTKGSLNVFSDGSFVFNPDSDFLNLNPGESEIVTFTYTTTDIYNEESNPGTVSVTVTCDSTLGLNDVSTSATTIYPNPVINITTINGLLEEQQLQLFNTSGQRVLSTKINSTNNTIDLSHLSNGVFYLKIKNETIKLIKK